MSTWSDRSRQVGMPTVPHRSAQPRGLPMAPPLYDALRGRYYPKPRLRGWLHLVWFLASLAVGPLVIASAHHTREVIASAIYVTIVCGLFGTSALYHRGRWGARISRAMQRVDHAMIFMMIAGTATPVFLLSAPGTYGVACLILLWVFTVLATGVHLARMDAPERLVGAVFVGLGLTAGLALPPLWIHRGIAAALLMLAGGALYLSGAVVYHRRKPDPSPMLFGYHEVFHALVCGAATCQYIAIVVFVL